MKKKMITKITSCCLILAMCISPVITAKAANVSHNEVIVSEEYALNQKQQMRYGEIEKITVLHSEYHTTTVTPNGQPPEGVSFPTGGGMYVNTSKGPSLSVGFSVSWGGVVSTSVSVGLAGTAASVGGYFLPAPDTINRYIAKIDKTYKVERHKVDVYRYNEYLYTYYSTPSTLAYESPYMQKVG
ncbi:hypothetical protein KQI61_07185 [Anaerocolumna aminovalerica]|uniref:hypothetical protein n=1 Tax=Anaerocolumna aminovalerica TaxID=1527 RepID=UPI001C0F37ED|nr:hypothetical protein [Anaerocolumna aminovalerica]MBU5331977.1 hypothetical protein [Anaerocolumna aminovalerica]